MRFIYTKTFAIFAGCLVLLALLVFVQTRGWLSPIRRAAIAVPGSIGSITKTISSPVKNFFSTIYQLRKINNDNTALLTKVAELQQRLVDADELARENETLRRELGFVETTTTPHEPCTVLSQNPFGSGGAVILNCGTEKGVQSGQAVISGGYLVGKIIYVESHSSTAQLITNSNFSVDARISQNDQPGIVRGSFGSGILLDQIPQTSGLEKGWMAVTAGINDKIPKNILIGEVTDLLSSNNDLFKKAALVSPIDFNNLQFVFVVK